MNFLFSLLIVVGIKASVDPFVYMFAEQVYRKNPEAEKTNQFVLLDGVFRHKYAKAISFAIGIICFAAAIIVF